MFCCVFGLMGNLAVDVADLTFEMSLRLLGQSHSKRKIEYLLSALFIQVINGRS